MKHITPNLNSFALFPFCPCPHCLEIRFIILILISFWEGATPCFRGGYKLYCEVLQGEHRGEREGDFNSCFWFQNIQIFIIFYTYAAYPFAKNDRDNQNLFDIFEIAMENFTLEKELCIVVKVIGEI